MNALPLTVFRSDITKCTHRRPVLGVHTHPHMGKFSWLAKTSTILRASMGQQVT